MAAKRKSGQRGMSLFSVVFVGAVIVSAAIVVMQVVPTYLEFLAITKAVKKASAGSTIAEVRTIFDRATSVDNISSITAKDIDVAKEGDKVVVSFSYQREIHLTGPAYLVMKYEGNSK